MEMYEYVRHISCWYEITNRSIHKEVSDSSLGAERGFGQRCMLKKSIRPRERALVRKAYPESILDQETSTIS